MRLKISEVTVDKDVYPRQNVSHVTVSTYKESLLAGAIFPPIEVQRIIDSDGTEKIIILDGWHRLLAHQEVGAEEIEASYWQNGVLMKEEHLNELRIEAAARNIRHGDKLSLQDRQFQARRIVELNPKIENEVLASKFDVTPQTVSGWVSDIRSRFFASRDAMIFKLNTLGRTQQEIGRQFNLDQTRVSQIISGLSQLKALIKSDFYEKRKSVEEICQYYHIDEPLAWALILDGKSDLDRFAIFGRSEYSDDNPRYFNFWNFSLIDKRLGIDYPGRLACQVMLNLLYYYTKQGDLVVDPMAGGGVAVDCCLVMNRKCRAYDLNPVRPEIQKNDVLNGIPDKNVDFIFLDPPYYNQKKDDYVANKFTESLKSFNDSMKMAIRNSHETLRSGGVLAFIMGPQQWKLEEGNWADHSLTVTNMALEQGFEEIYRVVSPLPTQQFTGYDVDRAKKSRSMLNQIRDIVIFQN
jgi:transcriptional regulator with XRE-family HTH domain